MHGARNDKAAHLRAMGVKLFEADLVQAESSVDAMADCTIVFHTASPVKFRVEDPQRDLVEPAVQGTSNVLETATRGADVVLCCNLRLHAVDQSIDIAVDMLPGVVDIAGAHVVAKRQHSRDFERCWQLSNDYYRYCYSLDCYVQPCAQRISSSTATYSLCAACLQF